MSPETSAKVELIRSMIAEKGLEGIVVNEQVNLAWLTGGRFFVNSASTTGVGSIWIGLERTELIVNNIEGERLWQEEGAGDVCDAFQTYPWYEEEQRNRLIKERINGLTVSTDQSWSEEFLALRLNLTLREQQRYRELGRSAGEAVESAAREFVPGESEYQVAARLARAAMERGMEPIVCLVGGDERTKLRRHPLPTTHKIDKYALLVLSGRRWGLVASVSRAVYFGRIPAELTLKQQAVNQVDAAYLAASRPGATLGEVFRAGQEAYARLGYKGEWQYHHQGGLAGYQTREVKATAQTGRILAVGQALAWNPTLQGTKAEDTVLVGENGLEVLTATGLFPTEKIDISGQSFYRPLILER
ncbi:metallopeptidase family M24 [Peptococcaceae bacterium CEB3]|nr:metallopeptidase family M24 [Peptococcaceae bacterium CEB3]